MKKFTFLLFALIFQTLGLSAQRTFYVSPDGNDANPGTETQPVYSLNAALKRTEISSAGDSIKVIVAPGEYQMKEPLVIEKSHPAKIIFEGTSLEKPVFRGGFPVSGWETWERGIWRTRVPEAIRYGSRFEQLYVNGRRATRARTPNKGWYSVSGSSETIIERGESRVPAYGVQELRLNPDDVRPLKKLSDEELKRVSLLFYHKWDVTRKPIEHAVADSGLIFTAGEGMKPWNAITKGSRYVLENYLGALDEPGEWFLSADGWLYYMPLEGEDMRTAEVYAPALEQLIVIKGESDRPVENISFRNLTFRTANYLMPPKGNEAMQAAAGIKAAIEMDYARNIEFTDCEISQTGAYAFWLRQECFDNRIERCHIHDLGAGGIKLGELTIRTDGRPVTARNTIHNNIIQHGGYVFPCGIGVGILQAAETRLTHNEISDFRYSGVSVGWKWGYNDQKNWTTHIDANGELKFIEMETPSPAVGNIVSNNHIHHIGWAELSDMGAVYTLGESPGTVVSNNVIHDIYSYDYGGWGLYTDEGSTDIVMENNLVYRCKSGGFHQHYGKNNIIRNNIFAFAYHYQLQFTRVEEHKSFDFTNNIVLMDRGVLLSGPWREARIDMDRNCYWSTRGIPYTYWDVMESPFLFGDLTFAEWQKHKDKHSIIADPMFRNPEAGDFTFKNMKTARRIGFKPFDYTKAGVYGAPEWVEKAKLSPDITRAFDQAVTEREAHYERIGNHSRAEE